MLTDVGDAGVSTARPHRYQVREKGGAHISKASPMHVEEDPSLVLHNNTPKETRAQSPSVKTTSFKDLSIVVFVQHLLKVRLLQNTEC